jgi:outer membrane protein
MGQQLALAERTYAVGTGTITDVQESRAKLAMAHSQRVSSDKDVEVKNAELEKLLGEPVVLPVLLPVDELTGQIDGVHALPSQEVEQLRYWVGAVPQNLQVQLQEAALEIARHETAKTQAGHMPTLDLVLGRSSGYSSGTLTSPADISTLTTSNSMSIQLSVPIYSGGGTQSRVREAIALEEKVRDDVIFAQRNAATQVRQAYSGVINGKAQVDALEAGVIAGRNALESNKIGLKIGTRITPDVLIAEQQLFASLRDLYKARIDTAMQSLKLKAAVGQLQPKDLQLTEQTLAQAFNR